MKKMNFLRSLLAACVILALVVPVSCEKEKTPEDPTEQPGGEEPGGEEPGGEEPGGEEPGGEEPGVELQPNTFYVDGTVTEVGSKVLGEMSGYVYLAATPTPGLTTIDEVMSEEDFMYVLVSPSQIGTEFDVMTESAAFTISGAWTGVSDYFAIAVDTYDDVESGTCLVEQTGENAYSFSFLATLADGTVIGMLADGILEEEVNNNTITVDGVTKILRSAFYTVEGGMHMLYVSAGDVETFDEMQEKALQYVYVIVPDKYADGQVIDLETNMEVMVGMIDNVTYGYYMPTEGTLKLTCTGTGAYELTMSGAKMTDPYADDQPILLVDVEYAGTAYSVDYAPEKKNEIVYNGETLAISGAEIVKTSASVWTIKLSVGNKTVSIVMPSSCFGTEYNAYGFSQYPDTMEIAYDGKVWNNRNGDTGTVSLALVGNELELNFTTYGELSGYYKGNI